MDDNYFEIEESGPLPPEGQQPDQAGTHDLEPEGPRPRLCRKRATQIGLVLVALVVVAVIFRSVVPSANSTPDGQVTPLPTTPPPMVLIQSNITFGIVSINGQRQRGRLPLLFGAHNGTYRITLEAPPFSSTSCMITFSNGAPENGTCNFSSGSFSQITVNGVTGVPRFAILVDFGAENLPQNQRDQINALLAKSTSQQQTTTVPAGSYIATSFNADSTITSERVTTPLQATASLVANNNFGSQFGAAGCVGIICQGEVSPAEMALLTGNLWMVGVPVALRWRFITSGQAISDVSFFPADLQTMLLAYSPSAGWSVSPETSALPFNQPDLLNNLNCETGAMALQQQAQGTFPGYNTSSGPGIEGCKITLLDQTGGSSGSFVWRFGVLLAADGTAHKLLPSLPIAPQAEINAVQS